jgi:hypothetical protein
MRQIIRTLLPVAVLLAGACGGPEQAPQYPANPSTLRTNPYIRLPLGAVKPAGWLADQLRVQADGLTGHLDEFWPDLIHSAWMGGEGEAWERSPYYLDGLVPLAYLLEDKRLQAKVRAWLEPILSSARPDGWFGPAANEDRWPLAVALKVLRQYYEGSGDERALAVIRGYFRFLHDHPPDWPDDTWRGVRAMEHAVTGYWLYRQTADPAVAETIASIFHNSYDWTTYYETFPWDAAAVSEGRVPHNWEADGLTAHVVNNAMAVKYPGLWFQQSGDERYRRAALSGLEKYDDNHGQVGGRFSGDEHLSGKRPTQGTEMCAIVELMFSLENMLEVLGEPVLADRLELLAYNSLPGTMTGDGWAHQYDQQANQVLVSVAERDWSTNGDTSNIYGLMPNYPCCLANMHQGWPKFVQHLWLATPDGGLAAMAYGPCRVEARVAGGTEVTVSEETEYPFDGAIRLLVHPEKPAEFPLSLRIPGWAAGATVRVGQDVLRPAAGEMIRLDRKWRDGDEVRLEFPLNIRLEERFNGAVAVRRGPLYFALRIGGEYHRVRLEGKRITSIDYLGSTDWEIRPVTPWNFALVLDTADPAGAFAVRRNPLRPLPFADIGEPIYRGEAGYQPWEHDAPLVLTVAGRRVAGWTLRHNSADDPPADPVAEGPAEDLTLVPYACTRLRIAEFPVLHPE